MDINLNEKPDYGPSIKLILLISILVVLGYYFRQFFCIPINILETLFYAAGIFGFLSITCLMARKFSKANLINSILRWSFLLMILIGSISVGAIANESHQCASLSSARK